MAKPDDYDHIAMKKQADELAAAFKAKGIEITNALGRGVLAASIFVEGEAKKKVPKDTGLLQGSITHRTILKDGVVIGQVGTNVEYAAYVEFGTGIYAKNGQGRKTGWFVELPNGKGFWTRGNKPQPFLTPALTENKTTISQIIAKELKKEL
jgi:HK97 gp10 family phage protein